MATRVACPVDLYHLSLLVLKFLDEYLYIVQK